MGSPTVPKTSREDKLNHDPLAFSTMSYPKDIINDPMAGHYMLFYVNVPSTTKFSYSTPGGGTIGNKVLVPEETLETTGGAGQTKVVQTGAETMQDRESKAKSSKSNQGPLLPLSTNCMVG